MKPCDVIDLYNSGLTVKQIAYKTLASECYVRLILKNEGIEVKMKEVTKQPLSKSMMEIGFFIIADMERTETTIKLMAEDTGISARKLTGYTKGELDIPMSHIEKLAEYYGFTVSEFFNAISG